MDSHLKITITNPLPFQRIQEPVTGGIPIPLEANIFNVRDLCLLDEQAQIIPCQFTPVSWWPEKNQIKWVILHFQTNVLPESSSEYFLQLNNQTSLNNEHIIPNIACLTNDQININTGKIQIEFQLHKTPNFFNASSQLFSPDHRLTLGAITKLKIEENGPQRAVIRLRGAYIDQAKNPANFNYEIRAEFYYDKSYFRLYNTIISKQDNNILHDASFILPNGTLPPTVYDTEGEIILKLNNDKDKLLQDSSHNYLITEKNNQQEVSGKFQGWINGTKLSAAVRFFGERFPKSLEYKDNQIKIGLLPEVSQVKDSFKPADDCLDHYSFPKGEARTHEMLLYIHHDDAEIELKDINRIMAGFHHPLLPTAPWEWYIDSKLFGDLTIRDQDTFPEFEKLIDGSLQVILNRRDQLDLYGDRNFGDDQMNKPGLWNNCEYDYPHVGILQFIRGASQDWYWKFALPAARHMMDIDIVNYGEDVGLVYPHSMRHNSVKPKLGSHSWLQGILEYFLISGDYRARDIGQLSGKRWAKDILAAQEIGGTERAIAWPLIAMLALDQVFGDPLYLEASQKLRDRIVELFNHELGHFEGCMKRENYGPSYWQVFLIGSPVLESLVMYDQHIGDQAVRDIIISIAKRLAKINWIENPGVWEYPRPANIVLKARNHTPKNDRMVSPGVGYAYLYSGEQELWDKAVTAFENRYGILDEEGKNIAQSLRFGVRMPALINQVNK